jgi:hypothetical protein
MRLNFDNKNFPRVVAVAPSRTKTTEKPTIKANDVMRVFRRTSSRFEAFCSSSTDTPDINEIYAGTSGRTQGERNESIPAKKAAKIET